MDNKIQKRGVYDAQGKLEYYIEAAEDLQYVNVTRVWKEIMKTVASVAI